MGLEEEIQQTKPFKSQNQKLVVNILYTHGWLQGKLRDVLKPFDLTVQQYNVLRILRGSMPAPLSTNTIRDRMLDKMSDASRIVDRLHAKTLVDRRVCPADRRLVDVMITKAGLDLLQDIENLQNGPGNVNANLTEAEAAELNRLLDRLRDK